MILKMETGKPQVSMNHWQGICDYYCYTTGNISHHYQGYYTLTARGTVINLPISTII